MTDSKYTSVTENTGHFRCETTYTPSGLKTFTDLPPVFNGLAEYPSPGAMLAATLASCTVSLLSVIAAKKEVDLTGIRIQAHAVETDQGVAQIALKIIMPLSGDHPLRSVLEKAAHTCPVRRSLRADLDTPIEWEWKN